MLSSPSASPSPQSEAAADCKKSAPPSTSTTHQLVLWPILATTGTENAAISVVAGVIGSIRLFVGAPVPALLLCGECAGCLPHCHCDCLTTVSDCSPASILYLTDTHLWADDKQGPLLGPWSFWSTLRFSSPHEQDQLPKCDFNRPEVQLPNPRTPSIPHAH